MVYVNYFCYFIMIIVFIAIANELVFVSQGLYNLFSRMIREMWVSFFCAFPTLFLFVFVQFKVSLGWKLKQVHLLLNGLFYYVFGTLKMFLIQNASPISNQNVRTCQHFFNLVYNKVTNLGESGNSIESYEYNCSKFLILNSRPCVNFLNFISIISLKKMYY